MTFKRILCLLAASAMVVSIAGCSGGESNASSAAPSSQAPASSAADSSSAPAESSAPAAATTEEAVGFEAVTVPTLEESLQKYPVEGGGKVSMWVSFNGTSAKYYQSLAEDISVKRYVKDTGIEIEFVHPASGQEKENFNLLVVSDSLPDILVNGSTQYAGGSAAAVADGVFADLTDLVSQYAPDYNYFLEQNDLFWRLATTDEGKVYDLYSYKDIQAPYYYRPQLRKDMLDEFGMETPKTLAQLEEFFAKVKEKYPDVAPYTPDKTGIDNLLLGTFNAGTGDNGKKYFVVDGKIHNSYLEPGFKDFLTTMSDWYAKGYINKDFTTITNKEQEFCAGRTAFLYGNTDTIYVLANEMGVAFDSIPFPRVNEGDEFHGDVYYFPQNGTPTAISAKSKNKELALQFMNYSFTKQGSAVINYGDPDISWSWSEEVYPEYQSTIPIYNDYALNCPDYPLSDIEYTVRLHTCWAKFRYGDDVMMIRNVLDPDCWAYRAKWGDDPTSDGAYAMPTLNFMPEIATEIGTLQTNVDTYADEMILKYITGVEPLSSYDSFVAEINNLGMPRLIEIYQTAYDALLNKSR
ncbi:MAG: extracellular solute-binding protein [Provencibacterium sp.]|nr:extracellular solute-binding protein [Provencibacterium sp.]